MSHPMKDVLSLEPAELERFLERRRASPPQFPLEMDLAENLVEVLRKANEFVPSQAGSILLDDPTRKHPDRRRNQLTFLAVFGDQAAALVGQTISSDRGIAGFVYQTGKAYFTSDAERDPYFDGRVDEETSYSTRSLVAIPIRIGAEVCGVLELLNREGAATYGPGDRDLLEIFAGYISIAIQNVLDGRLAHEYAKRDNLTGLFNDRYLHSALDHAVDNARRGGEELAVLFLDLDYFKRVNDSYGHLAGSQVLRDVGHLLRSRFEANGAILARYGGDEFVITVPCLDAQGALALAEALRAQIAEAVFCNGRGDICADRLNLQGLTCSIGIATLRSCYRPGLSTPETKSLLLREADSAMYLAKEAGRDRVRLAPGDDYAAHPSLTPPKGA
jgi:diguanylate cyclase (GGDEF)-like protein